MKLTEVSSVDNRGIMFPTVKSGEADADSNPIGNDVTSYLAIRQAINVALDRQAIVDGVLEGYGTKAYGVPFREQTQSYANQQHNGTLQAILRFSASSSTFSMESVRRR